MDTVRCLDDFVTREFSFIQELIWSAPHKNPFPLCSSSILSKLKSLISEWRNASSITQQSAINLITMLDIDTKTLIELRKQYLDLLAPKRSPGDAFSNIMVSLEKKVDSILVQHIEDAWKGLDLISSKFHAQRQMNINRDGLSADVLEVFEDAIQQSESCIKDEMADGTSKMPEADHRDMNDTEIRTKCFPSPLQSQSSSPKNELFSKISGTSNATTLMETASSMPESNENSLTGTNTERNLCVISRKPLFFSTQAQSAANEGQYFTPPPDKGPNYSIFSPAVSEDVGRGESNDPSQCSFPTDRESTATFDVNRCMKQLENHMEDAAEDVSQPHESISAIDEYYSASSDGEHDASTREAETKNSVDADFLLAMVAKGSSASLSGENGSETTEVQRSLPTARPGCPGRMQVFLNNTDINRGVQNFDEDGMCHSPNRGKSGAKKDFEDKSFEECPRDEELIEVEMTLRAKICEPEGEEPYWHVIFALLNHSNSKISVQKLEYWSLDKQDDVKCIYWPPGEMILREQPSFLCYSIKLPCCALNTSPRLAFSWQYRKLPEWIPTKGGKPKLEKVTIRKRFGDFLGFGDAQGKHKGHVNLKSAKKRIA